jgi:AbrB family looped-hinge helix DNA binding protein
MGNEDDKQEYCITDHFFGMATVGERGQIVIPAEARKKHRINTGDKLLIMGTPDTKGLMLVKIDAMREFMTTIMQELQRVEQSYQERRHEKTEEADF